jgi:tellurite resistance protein TehA-like permease
MGDFLLTRARALDPGYFALVMATGIVSIGASLHGMQTLARILLALNAVAYLCLVTLSVVRLTRARYELLADFANPARGAGFLTFSAGSCVLASQLVVVVRFPVAAIVLTTIGALSWAVLIYTILAVVITGQHKPGFRRSINGGWLIAVVATQSIVVAIDLLVANASAARSFNWLFIAVCLYLIGGALYLILITLIFQRLLFLPLDASGFTPPYWINMGALAITTLAGSMLVLNGNIQPSLAVVMPFVRGFTLFFWATATWWIPLLTILELWHHGLRHMKLGYATADWDIVFPIGMYAVCTDLLARALSLNFLKPVSAVVAYASLAAWLLVAVAALRFWLPVTQRQVNE